MNNSTPGKTMLEYIPKEILYPKRKTNRLWTLVIILIIALLFGAFWIYQKNMLITPPVITPITPSPKTEPQSISEIQASLAETDIPSFHETL